MGLSTPPLTRGGWEGSIGEDGKGSCFSPYNYIVNKRIILKKKMCMNESGSERAYDNIAVGAFENKFSKHHNNITILLEDYSFIH